MKPMENVLTYAFAKRAAISRLLRYMMFENPLEGEQYAAEVDNSELKNANVEDGAVEFHNPDGRIEYIVYSHGTRYTTDVRPTHIPDDKIRRVTSQVATDRLWRRLQAECQALKSISVQAYTKFDLEKVIASIEYFYSRPSSPEERPPARYIEALSHLGQPFTLADDGAIRTWIDKCRNHLLKQYASYVLAGDEVKHVLTTLTFFEYCPFPLTSLLEMNREFLPDYMGKPIVMSFPLVDIRFYLEHPAIRPDLAVVWATSTARTLQKNAEQLRDEAKLKYTIEQFHSNLYFALLHYRCALYAYRVVLSLAKAGLAQGERAMQRIKEARTEVALCEEHRVVIMASLTAALGIGRLFVPSIANVEEVHNWVEKLVALSPANAEFAIREAYDAELIMPRFLRDICLGFASSLGGKTKQGLAKMLGLMQDLEKHITEAMFLGDPNYLSTTYGLMSQICLKNGMKEESLKYSRRAEPSYYQKLVNPA